MTLPAFCAAYPSLTRRVKIDSTRQTKAGKWPGPGENRPRGDQAGIHKKKRHW